MLMETAADPDAHLNVRTFITAGEAYPEFEKAFLEAETEIWGGFRVFDLATNLRSDAAREIGETWFDLIVHTLERGVRITFILSDFDPIVGDTLHCMTWKAKRAFIAAAEAAEAEDLLTVIAATHSARVGMTPRLMLWPRMLKELYKLAGELNAASPARRDRRLETSPGLRPWLIEDDDERLRPRKWPPPPIIPATHHQKLAVFDRRVLYIGGLDLDERRFDDKKHRRRREETWHDVQIMCEGAVVEDAQRHLETFLDVVADEAELPPQGPLLTTLSRSRRNGVSHMSPYPLRCSIADAHFRLIPRAKRLIYMETQFFRDVHLAKALADAGTENPDLTMILIIPAAPEDVAFDNNTASDARFGEFQQARALRMIEKAFGDRLAILTPVRPVEATSKGRDTLYGSPIIYVHAKVSIFDEDRAIISSANLNGRSMYWDTEAGVLLEGRDKIAGLRAQVLNHWHGGHAGAEFHDPKTACTAWKKRAEHNLDLAREARDGFLVPYPIEPGERFGRRLPGVPDALV